MSNHWGGSPKILGTESQVIKCIFIRVLAIILLLALSYSNKCMVKERGFKSPNEISEILEKLDSNLARLFVSNVKLSFLSNKLFVSNYTPPVTVLYNDYTNKHAVTQWILRLELLILEEVLFYMSICNTTGDNIKQV